MSGVQLNPGLDLDNAVSNSECDEVQEYDSDEIQYINKKKTIRRYRVNDYMQCEETHKILETVWYNDFIHRLEDPITRLFNKYFNQASKIQSSFLYCANKEHGIVLLDILQHHIQRRYNTQIFKEQPDLALPLLQQKTIQNKIIKKERAIQVQRDFQKVNKEYTWGKNRT